MKYKELSKIYHMNRSSTRESDLLDEESARRNADSTFLTGFETSNGELFLATPRELSVLNEKVLRTERTISQLIGSIPSIASNAVLRGIVLDEVVSTNSIEDIHSTKRQIKNALESRKVSHGDHRFRELALLYLSILDDTAQIPRSAQDIRRIYDKVMANELDKGKQPDGRFFRKDGVDITEGGVRIIHTGLQPESAIIDAIESMLNIVQSGDIPTTYAAILSHYLFEYAHPFYDGNGRTGRYLLSLFLSEVFSTPTVLSLSRIIAENRDAYYNAFRSVENPLNKGELTFFVYEMLNLIHKAQLGIIARLESSRDAFDGIEEKIKQIESDYALKPQELQAVSIFIQYNVFGLLGDVSLDEMTIHLGVGRQMARRHMTTLEESKIIEKWSQRKPLSFTLTEAFKNNYGLESPEWQIWNLA